jgi:hypothetical protein
MDSYAIAGAIAARKSAISTPSGYEAIKVATADLPDTIGFTPTLLVMPPVMDEANYNASRSRTFTLLYPCALYLSQADGTPRRAKAVHDWFTAVYPMQGGQLQLGLSYVALATLIGLEARVMPYGGTDYDGLHWFVRVRISEVYTPAA